jgi:hypothetical protein
MGGREKHQKPRGQERKKERKKKESPSIKLQGRQGC